MKTMMKHTAKIEQAFERNFDREFEFEREQLQHGDACIVEIMN